MTKAASWGGFGEVLANLVVHRCRVIPLVSQAFRCVHNDYPPQRKALKLEHPITRGMIVWFNKTASSLERLEVDLRGDVPGCLSQMLAMAAITAPNLDDLKYAQFVMTVHCCPASPSSARSKSFQSEI